MKTLKNIIGTFCLLAVIPACQFKNAVLLPVPSAKPAPIRDHYVILINLDGARPTEMNEGVAAGRLPTFKKLFYEEGARFESALTVFPTVSTPSHQAMVSGLFPGHHGIPALDWFSRPLLTHYDYLIPKDILYTNTLLFNSLQLRTGEIETDAPQLIFHTLKGHPTMTVFESTNYGVTHRFPKHPPVYTALQSHHGKAYEQLDYTAVKDTLEAFKTLPAEELPRFSMISCYGMDITSHFDGPESPRVADLYVYYDRFLKELVGILKKRDLWDKTTLVVVSDHGQHALKGVVDLPAMLYEMGLHIDRTHLKKSQVVWGDHGTGTSNLYFKIGEDWRTVPSYEQLRNYPIKDDVHVDLVKTFLAYPDIETVIIPEGPWKTHLFFKNQHAVIERKWVKDQFLYAYQPDSKEDPLGYMANPTVRSWVEAKHFKDAEDWLRETHSQPMPDVVVSVPQIFDDYRTGDMIIVTVKDKQFKEDKLYGHGSLHAEDRRVVLLWHGPDINPGIYRYARIVDLYPTILALFGLKTAQPLDGVVRSEIFQEKFNTIAQTEIEKNPGMDAPTFRNFLEEKRNDPELSKLERQRAEQLLFDLRQFLAAQETEQKQQLAEVE